MGNASNLLYSTCNAHSANLLAGDIVSKPVNSKIMRKVTTVQKDFRRTGLTDLLLKAGGHKPALPCATRWTSQRSAGESFLKNLSTMKTVTTACEVEAESDKDTIRPKPIVSSRLFNQKFVASVKSLVDILDPVAKLTNYCQKSTSSVADAAEKWLELLQDGPVALRPFVESRMKQSNILNDVTLTANFFHPIYRGKRLNEDQHRQVTSYVFDKLKGPALESLHGFTKGKGAFASLAQKKIVSPKAFWHFADQLGHGELATFALDYLKIPASTAQLERLFSNWAYVHNDIRNRLSTETSKKLVNTNFTLRTTDEIIEDDDEDFEMEGEQFGTDDESDQDE
ncbi:uncharacterized protein LOC129571881 [Sitodiplosis mosellana]|uniref:uncharacterized protein LOC129571881 n=1 Tax=Sitodiplosis mosellana TaxID=263140 RepID=UPI002443BD2D|nr:uncharacterized protein LOC129571881 [Sitodiplosis mosellana]